MTEAQKKMLNERANTLSVDRLLNYILSGEVSLDELPNLDAARRQAIEDKINSMPNPVEQAEWAKIQAMVSSPSQELLGLLSQYIRKWEGSRPAENHVDEATALYQRVEDAVKEQLRQIEENDWQAVDPFNKSSLLGHKHKYPNTVHANEIDDGYWDLVNKENVGELQEYLTILPKGNHVNDANQLLNAIYEWNNIKASNDLLSIADYIRCNPESPFKQQAQILIMGLKQQEIQDMRNNPNGYGKERLMDLINANVFTDNELIRAGVMTENVLATLRETNINADLPDMNNAIKNSWAECKPDHTDVFFFGVPSTGKTCVLMGLSRSNALHVKLASGGGDYAAALQQYTDVGITVPRTPGTFVTTLEADVTSGVHNDTVHKVNLVEMSGEEFAFGIANNDNHIFSFEAMGSGATKLLQNDNRKVFFLIIDPTANVVRINREVIDGFDENGDPIVRLEQCIVNQRTLIQKMVDLLCLPENHDIMMKVDSIHIIMTKSDVLGDPIQREERAYNIFVEKFGTDILTPLMKLCKDCNINAPYNFHPKLYTFSLGTFYVGGLYEYEPTDSNRLVTAIRNSTRGTKEKTWWDKLKEVVN